MKRRIYLLLFLISCLICPDCGKKGPLSPPLMKTPQAVKDLSISQKGDKLILTWTNPTAYADGNPIKEISEVELWLTEEDKSQAGPEKKLTAEEFENKAKLLAKVEKSQFSAFLQKGTEAARLSFAYPLEAGKIGRVIMTFALRIRDERKRVSEFSEPLSVTLVPSPLPPQNVRASLFERYIEVRWETPAEKTDEPAPPQPVGYNVYRSEGEEPSAGLNSSPVKGDVYQDKNFSFGKSYRYFVRAVVSAAVPLRESDDSDVVEILAKDSFPPASPSGLTIISGSGFVALSWEANKEPDLAGYKVWRRAAGEADFILLAPLPATESSYSDSLVEKNKRYDYAITALDNAGNESQKSETASGIIRDSPA